jgi:hypothetical protein
MNDIEFRNFLDGEILEDEVKTLLKLAVSAKIKADKHFGRNVVDPFAAIFEIAGFKSDHHAWKISETARQAQKTLQNGIGEFHQKILGSVPGWTDMRRGSVVDLRNDSLKIIAEIKNKFSTVSGGKLADVYKSLDGLVSPKNSIYKDYTAYFVNVISKKKKRSDIVFTPSDKDKGAKCPSNPLIRIIDGASFYDLVFQRANSLQEIHRAVPQVVNKIAVIDKTIVRISPEDVLLLLEYAKRAFPT